MIKIISPGRLYHFLWLSNFETLHEWLTNNKMFKKAISILLLIVYTSTAFAITVNAHYCAGEFSEMFLVGYGEAHCGCDHSDPTHKDCCTDKIISVKTDNHKTGQSYILTQNWIPVILSELPHPLQHKYNQQEEENNYNFPSGFIRSHSPFYLTFLCIFRV